MRKEFSLTYVEVFLLSYQARVSTKHEENQRSAWLGALWREHNGVWAEQLMLSGHQRGWNGAGAACLRVHGGVDCSLVCFNSYGAQWNSLAHSFKIYEALDTHTRTRIRSLLLWCMTSDWKMNITKSWAQSQALTKYELKLNLHYKFTTLPVTHALSYQTHCLFWDRHCTWFGAQPPQRFWFTIRTIVRID